MNDSGKLQQVVLHQPGGLRVELLNLGAAIRAIRVPTEMGSIDVVLGYEQPTDYLGIPTFLGATVGRYAGRIAKGRFKLGRTETRLETDPRYGPHTLHGGPKGLHMALVPIRCKEKICCRAARSEM